MNRAQTQKLGASEPTSARAHARVLGAVTNSSPRPNLKLPPSIDTSGLHQDVNRRPQSEHVLNNPFKLDYEECNDRLKHTANTSVNMLTRFGQSNSKREMTQHCYHSRALVRAKWDPCIELEPLEQGPLQTQTQHSELPRLNRFGMSLGHNTMRMFVS